MKLAVLSALVASAAAFAPSKPSAAKTTLAAGNADLEALAEKLNPKVKFYDPLNLAEQNFWGMGNEATVAFLRQSEIKHGRIAMFAFVGYIVQSNVVFPWPQTLAGAAHPSTDLAPEAQWDAVPVGAKWQIFAVISLLELWDECGGGGAFPHYTKGREPGKYPPFTLFRENVHFVLDLYDPLGFSKKKTDEQKARGKLVEINNGRLAMLGIFGFLSADKVPGSVPALDALGVPIPYEGDPMIPFEGQFSYF
uniref:Plastid light harvesting protein n=1 Tax=Grammatophora oceanica TaxID=210454 RepID=A0A7S1VVI7_9STRA|mmetsp:Transcript_7001/g.10196  ORF Transcript_7001/g.10196 Transcript_7001/m.10196 type:complete len:251 (+) Transcript_7001:91-843(+)|eukprot:CAMPEP_0194030578 /NCGR_PEP_ID=MMETSP0009_2-20130614/4008_1 /TAXON_ID=210454 /ORGANISM="Grammatophora oceanica, Strain CCMP 410" /LENGTH=250 /DNA_ID=CAMNT_0038670549 /DNA_START=91 /DNA_END=843 /DNA_ORIENTATION=-